MERYLFFYYSVNRIPRDIVCQCQFRVTLLTYAALKHDKSIQTDPIPGKEIFEITLLLFWCSSQSFRLWDEIIYITLIFHMHIDKNNRTFTPVSTVIDQCCSNMKWRMFSNCREAWPLQCTFHPVDVCLGACSATQGKKTTTKTTLKTTTTHKNYKFKFSWILTFELYGSLCSFYFV